MLFFSFGVVPGAVENVTVTVVNQTTVLVRWDTLSKDMANGIVVGYELTVFKENDFTVHHKSEQSVDVNTVATITGLGMISNYNYSLYCRTCPLIHNTSIIQSTVYMTFNLHK